MVRNDVTLYKSISSIAEYVVALQKSFLTSKFSYSLFFNPTHTANRSGTTKSKPPQTISTMVVQSLKWARLRSYLLHFLEVHNVIVPYGAISEMSKSQIIFITLFFGGTQCYCALCQQPQTLQSCWAKTIFSSQTGIFWLFFIQFYCAALYIEHAGDALSRLENLIARWIWQKRTPFKYSLVSGCDPGELASWAQNWPKF